MGHPAAVDITNPQTWNRYAYVLNNPLSFVDPLGLDCGSGTTSSFAPHQDGNFVSNVSGSCPPPSFGDIWGGILQPIAGLLAWEHQIEPPDHAAFNQKRPQQSSIGPTVSQQPPKRPSNQSGGCQAGQHCSDAYQSCINTLLVKATWAGMVEGIGGAPDEVKELVHYVSTNKTALGAVASVNAGSYFALSEGAAATVATGVSSWAIPVATGAYVGWRFYEGYKAADTNFEQNAAQCDQL